MAYHRFFGRIAFAFLLVVAHTGTHAQSAQSQKALNNFADYANQSAEEISRVVLSLIQYYPTISQKNSWQQPRYTCPLQQEDYYLKTALAEARQLSPAIASGLTSRLNDLAAVAQRIDEHCKALDTYHKLEDYKRDNFDGAKRLIGEVQRTVREYRQKQDALWTEMETAHARLNPTAAQSTTAKADAALRSQIRRERAYLDTWTFNLNEAVPTGLDVDGLQRSIAETDEQLSALKRQPPALKYPASSMWSNFTASLGTVLEAKRNALNGYNNEARKSDAYANDVYLGLINYFNGALVSDQNSFVQSAAQDNYRGLKAVKYFPLFEIRTEAKTPVVVVKPFEDRTRTPVSTTAQKTAITKAAHQALINYVALINETYRQHQYLSRVLANLGSSAAYYKTLASYERHGGMTFDYRDFELPLAEYQKTISESKQLPAAFAGSLNPQAEVLMNIMKELDQISATLEQEITARKYEQDRVAHVYLLLERAKELLDTWDERKEFLYSDVRTAFDTYPAAQPASSWYLSGKALRELADLDHQALFQAKAFYQGNGQPAVSPAAIEEAIRNVVSNEYQNMKGIQKFGRSNGLCPYSPYEDLPESSKQMAGRLNPLAAGNGTGYEHPYYRIVYHYNDVVRHYNKFCELSRDVPLLPAVYQPELFVLAYPKGAVTPETTSASTHPVASSTATREQPANDTPANHRTTPDGPAHTTNGDKKVQTASTESQRVNQATRVERDTIYIERRDTVYLTASGENLRSMEGYAINHMILLLDVSGSMNNPDKLPLLKQSVLELMAMMRPEDKVSIVAFSDKPKVLLTASSFKDEARIRDAINALKSAGKTDGNAGVKLAYKVADENYIRGGNNRIILATDGEFQLNEGARTLISRFSNEDVFLSIFNFGKGAGASRALQQIAALGRGNYQYISRDNVELQLIREAKAKRAR